MDIPSGRIIRLPIGTDPGFPFSVGLVDRPPNLGDMLIERIDAADPDLARTVTGEPWRSASMRKASRRVTGRWRKSAQNERRIWCRNSAQDRGPSVWHDVLDEDSASDGMRFWTHGSPGQCLTHQRTPQYASIGPSSARGSGTARLWLPILGSGAPSRSRGSSMPPPASAMVLMPRRHRRPDHDWGPHAPAPRPRPGVPVFAGCCAKPGNPAMPERLNAFCAISPGSSSRRRRAPPARSRSVSARSAPQHAWDCLQNCAGRSPAPE